MKTTQQLYKALYSAIRSGGMCGIHKAFQSVINERNHTLALRLSFAVEKIHCRRGKEPCPLSSLDIRLTTYKYRKQQKAEQMAICTDNGLNLMLLN